MDMETVHDNDSISMEKQYIDEIEESLIPVGKNRFRPMAKVCKGILLTVKYWPYGWVVKLRRFLLRFVIGSMGKDLKVKDNVQLDLPENMFLGDRVGISQGCFLSATGGITVGNDVMVGHYSSILTEDHQFESTDVPMKEQGIVVKPVIIEDDVWIGAGVRILKGVTIGRGSVIGANSVVTHDVPAFVIAAGAPARVVKRR